MSFEDLLKSSVNGLPTVKYNQSVKYGLSNIGKVTTIKDTPGGYKGCAVRFEGLDYDTWFYAEHGTDKRTKYMFDLELF